MNEKLLRVYQQFDVKKIKANLLIYGDVSGQCANCDTIDIKLNCPQCPQCQNYFYYIAFRNIKSHLPKIYKLFEENLQVKIIDYDDYKHNLGASKAEEFFR